MNRVDRTSSTGTGNPRRSQESPYASLEGGQEAVLDGLSTDEQVRLRRFRQMVVDGRCSDFYPVDRKQDFVRYLIDQGKLSDN